MGFHFFCLVRLLTVERRYIKRDLQSKVRLPTGGSRTEACGVRFHSWRSARIGSIRAARFAGKNPDIAAIADRISMVAATVKPS